MIKSLGEKDRKTMTDLQRPSDVSTGRHAHCHHPSLDNHHLSPFKDRASLSLRKGDPDLIFTGNDRGCNINGQGRVSCERKEDNIAV